MKSDVSNVTELKAKPNDSLVVQLRRMLEAAEEGHLQSLAWIGVRHGGMSENGSVLSDGEDLVALLGESVLLTRNIARVVENNYEPNPYE